MGDIKEQAAIIAGNESKLRDIKREVEKKLRAERRPQEHIDYCLKQVDDAKEADKINDKFVKELEAVGYAITAGIEYTRNGSHIVMGLAPIPFDVSQEAKKTQNA